MSAIDTMHRVKADEVETLREGISGMDKFNELAADYIDATVALTEQRHGAGANKTPNSEQRGAWRGHEQVVGICVDARATTRGVAQRATSGCRRSE
ncbi:MAG: hypothetical protein ACI9JZ_001315 [Lentimonas sp.]|jgi:hypothetical protein